MKLHLRNYLITCALACAAVAAQAQPVTAATPASGPEAHSRHHDPVRMAERVNKRLADLKLKVQVTAAQESAWASFANAMQPQADRQRPDREAIARMSTPDRIDHMRVLRSQRNAEMDRRADATKAFYAQLTAAQKTTFDAETARLFQRHGGKHH